MIRLEIVSGPDRSVTDGSQFSAAGWEHDSYQLRLVRDEADGIAAAFGPFPWRQGVLCDEPQLLDVLEALLSDQQTVTSCADVADFLDEMGYASEGATGVRRGLAAWEQIKAQTSGVLAVLGVSEDGLAQLLADAGTEQLAVRFAGAGDGS